MDNGLELNGAGVVADYDGNGMPAFNYNPNATEENGTCITITYGCTNQLADNYDPNANTNDGSCAFEMPNPLFFSEYAEGSSNHKYLEIYNAGLEAVSLADYALARTSNGSDGTYETWSDVFPADASIAPGDVFVVAHSSADAVIAAVTDVTFDSLSNGDDGFALVMGTQDNHVYVDWVGDFNGDPGSGWSVCGESNGTQNATPVSTRCYFTISD
jgi:hypothetical protein